MRLAISAILLMVGAVGTSLLMCLKIYPGLALSLANDSTIVIVKADQSLDQTPYEIYSDVRMYTAFQIFELLTIPLQTYLLTALSSNPRIMQNIRSSPRKSFILTVSLQFLAMSNLMFWMNGSFLEFELIEKSPWTRVVYGDKWMGIAQFTLPILLFFRFHSVHMIVEIYVKLWCHSYWNAYLLNLLLIMKLWLWVKFYLGCWIFSQ